MRFLGALVLDAGAYENVEADRRSAMQSVVVVMAVCVAGGIGAVGFGLTGVAGFVTGAIVSLGAWMVWAVTIITLGIYSAWARRMSSWRSPLYPSI